MRISLRVSDVVELAMYFVSVFSSPNEVKVRQKSASQTTYANFPAWSGPRSLATIIEVIMRPVVVDSPAVALQIVFERSEGASVIQICVFR